MFVKPDDGKIENERLMVDSKRSVLVGVLSNNVPDNATKSPMSRPCCWKLAMRLLRVEFGAGINCLAPLKLAVRESFLPKWTFHPGPPLFMERQIAEYDQEV